jgi:Asp-tRNA(Asn)/Glu-tRNA(Gln) amidotransferase A subunit family amidase
MPDLRSKGPGGLNLLTATELSGKLKTGKTTSEAIVQDCLDRIAARNSEIRSWAYINPELALNQARACDAQPRRSALHGIPIGIKDLFDTYDMPTAYGSAIYENFRPATDTGLVGLMRRAGMVILGKCKTTEFGSPVPVGVRNPHDLTRSPGVSSSGSAAAVADYMVPVSLGSQTGGSTIRPAAFCGLVGYKPTLSGLDRGGIRHLRPTLDTMGVFARSISDIALLRGVLSGRKSEIPPADIHKSRIGVYRTMDWSQAQPETVRALEYAARELAAAGADVRDIEVPAVFAEIHDSFGVISAVEAARAMAHEGREKFSELNHWNRDALTAAKQFDDAHYGKAQYHAIQCQNALMEIFKEVDAIITPSALGEATTDLVSTSRSTFNRIWTLMHVPCVTIPAFEGPHGMPIGLQVVGPLGEDDRILALCEAIADALATSRDRKP